MKYLSNREAELNKNAITQTIGEEAANLSSRIKRLGNDPSEEATNQIKNDINKLKILLKKIKETKSGKAYQDLLSSNVYEAFEIARKRFTSNAKV